MKKRIQMMAVSAMLLSGMGIISCSSDDSSPTPPPPIEVVEKNKRIVV